MQANPALIFQNKEVSYNLNLKCTLTGSCFELWFPRWWQYFEVAGGSGLIDWDVDLGLQQWVSFSDPAVASCTILCLQAYHDVGNASLRLKSWLSG